MKQRRQSRPVLSWTVRLVLVAAVAAVWLLPPIPDRTTDTASITSYDAAMELGRDGTLTAAETLVVSMPGGKRGIFRIFDTADPRRDDVEHPVQVDAVERDGQPEPYVHLDSAAGTDTIRIGQESVYLTPGQHTYRIVSRTVDVLEPGDPGETWWWWDVVGAGWQMSIGSVDVEVALPAVPLRAECVVDDGDCSASVEGTTLRVTTGPLEPYTPVTVRVAFDEDDLDPPIPGGGDAELWWSLAAAVLAGVVAVALVRASRERAPGFPVLFEPPFLVPPVLGARVLDERDSDADLQATLFDLAERGVVALRGGDDVWHVEVAQPLESEHLHPIEATLLTSLGLRDVGDSFLVASTESSGRKVSTARKALRAQVAASASTYLHSSAAGTTVVIVGWLCLLGTLVMAGAYFFADGFLWGPLLAAAAAFAVVAAGAMLSSGTATVRTAEGRDLWSRTGGFARFLTTDSSEARFDASAHLDWYPRYLAWAVALGVADEWARRYEAQGVEVPDVPWIVWTGTGHRFDASSATRSFDGAIASASAAYAASQASSSGGGGFSGGSGGGGGGGGSW